MFVVRDNLTTIKKKKRERKKTLDGEKHTILKIFRVLIRNFIFIATIIRNDKVPI